MLSTFPAILIMAFFLLSAKALWRMRYISTLFVISACLSCLHRQAKAGIQK
jgi:hypothetical protein